MLDVPGIIEVGQDQVGFEERSEDVSQVQAEQRGVDLFSEVVGKLVEAHAGVDASGEKGAVAFGLENLGEAAGASP